MAFPIGPTREVARKATTFASRGVIAAWHWLWLNRMVIGIASLVWLILRSGSQPRRLRYPCQRAAAANVGLWAFALVPTAFLRVRHPHHPNHGGGRVPFRRRALILGRTLVLACLLVVAGWVGVRAYDYVSAYAAGGETPVPLAPGPTTPTTVAIVRDADGTITDEDVDAMVRSAVAKAGGLSSVMPPGSRVCIKPNLVVCDSGQWVPPYTYRLSGVVTDVRVVKAVATMCWEAGAGSVRIVEGTASDFPFTYFGRDVTWRAFKDAGYDLNGDHVFDYDTRVALVDLNDAGGVDQHDPNKVAYVEIPNPVLRTHVWMPKAILRPDQGGDCDVLITVPVLKNHHNGGFTMALKNRVGCLPSDIYYHPDVSPNMKWGFVHTNSKFPYDAPNQPVISGTADEIEDQRAQYSVVDVNLVRPQQFAVIDGLVGINNGPVGDNDLTIDRSKAPMSIILAGVDSVAIDAVGMLAMGYNPMYSKARPLGWAESKGLGTRNTSIITVVGDHLRPSVRKDFRTDWNTVGMMERADFINPSLTDISLAEGATVSGIVAITGLGAVMDNIGLVKAELEVDGKLVATNTTSPVVNFNWCTTSLKDGPHTVKVTVYDAALNEASKLRNVTVANNLLTNGDFETGTTGTGWTKWSASWSTNHVQDFTSTEPGHVGNRCLNLRVNTGGSASFGVYQEVTTIPGHVYKLDAWWKGIRYGADNWAETMLIDGSFSMYQADEGGPIVLLNHMYAYDANPPAQPFTADFGWIWGHDQNGTTVDTNARNGLRTASGTVMTVVLKAGAYPNPDANAANVWWDEVSLVDMGPAPTPVPSYTLTTAATAGGTVTTPGIGSFQYSSGTAVTLVATANPGYYFAGWAGDTASIGDPTRSGASTTITMNADASITANFATGSPSIARSPAALSPTTVVGADAAGQTFTVRNSGGGALHYTIADDANADGIDWLSCSPPSGDSSGETDTINVTYNTSSLALGTYNATITINNVDVVEDVQTIDVTLSVTTRPVMTCLPYSLTQSVRRGRNAVAQSFTCQNTGGSTLNYSITDSVSWLSCAPASGASTGEVDTITVVYSTSSLPVGTYDAAITITDPNATGSPQVIGVTLGVLPNADFDNDSDVDLTDFSLFQLCFNGPNRSPSSLCAANADFDSDGDVDLGDFAVFQGCFNGPNRAPACD